MGSRFLVDTTLAWLSLGKRRCVETPPFDLLHPPVSPARSSSAWVGRRVRAQVLNATRPRRPSSPARGNAPPQCVPREECLRAVVAVVPATPGVTRFLSPLPLPQKWPPSASRENFAILLASVSSAVSSAPYVSPECEAFVTFLW